MPMSQASAYEPGVPSAFRNRYAGVGNQERNVWALLDNPCNGRAKETQERPEWRKADRNGDSAKADIPTLF